MYFSWLLLKHVPVPLPSMKDLMEVRGASRERTASVYKCHYLAGTSPFCAASWRAGWVAYSRLSDGQ